MKSCMRYEKIKWRKACFFTRICIKGHGIHILALAKHSHLRHPAAALPTYYESMHSVSVPKRSAIITGGTQPPSSSGTPGQPVPVSGASSSNQEPSSAVKVRPRIRTSGVFRSEILSWNIFLFIGTLESMQDILQHKNAIQRISQAFSA
ncbi:hypothetical protein M413DRAFT_367429 [Hebeloma cylindrosporum]|uniref:Uncharacterized protein n=1 Tax=Hebeloma cylindrosporum TaxID=76867 RepID=A0A0C3CME8_HEBCY|nr:hypothetical protein M413DRAFT_367429 [Hebeloma cylindrosporum h7]